MKAKQNSQENLVQSPAKSAELSQVKIEQLNKQPILETSITISKDKKWVLYRTVITDIKPASYLKKVLG